MINHNPPTKLADLPRVIWGILDSRQGRSRALKRSEIIRLIRQLPGYHQASDRHIRQAIETLRDAGRLISSTLDDTGYFVASSPLEYLDFRTWYTGYAKTIFARAAVMDRTAGMLWGAASLQPQLISS